ncbi:Transcription factor [Niveomyces insectorum RCEF 264]|uniref:Transcription factor n=1 Tax=Niveomyces insectorum RCEF 264 TaxID=1081102 RepID=A0A167NHA7_9HYPO|nr:Transcription factor [Niveomyces insectorum RCEF 264]
MSRSSSTTSNGGLPATSKVAKLPRQSKSCKRCFRRKQRCHGFPVCRACEEARVPCEPSAYALQLHGHDSSSHAAFQRIQTLEAQLAGALDELAVYRGHAQQTQQHQSRQPERQPQQQQTQQQQPEPLLPDGFLIGNRGADPSQNLPPVPPPSAYHDTMPLLFGDGMAVSSAGGGTTVDQMVQSTVWTKGLLAVGDGVSGLSPLPPFSPLSVPTAGPPAAPTTVPMDNHTAGGDRSHSGSGSGSASGNNFTDGGTAAPPPEDAMGRRMLEAYFARIHPRYPFLDRAELFALHACRQEVVSPASPAQHRFDAFKLNMVYAIGGTLVKLTDPLSEAQAEGYLTAALRDVAAVQAGHMLQMIEGLVLLVLYNLRAPTNTGIWYMTNLAMQTCIDLGLHREAAYAVAEDGAGAERTATAATTSSSPQPQQQQQQQQIMLLQAQKRQKAKMRRLFWSVYVLDRFIALSFKRPFSIPEHDIETHMPTEADFDGSIPPVAAHRDLAGGSSGSGGGGAGGGHPHQASAAMWRGFLGIKRLESRIQTEIYGLGEPYAQRRAKIRPLLAALDAWRQALPPLPESESVYLQLQWNGAVAQLLRPFLGTMRDDGSNSSGGNEQQQQQHQHQQQQPHKKRHHRSHHHPLIVRCLHAAGNVCALFTRMHQRDAYGHSFVSAHLTFIAGVTMCYCLFLAPHLFDGRVANQLRACSSTMFIIAEKYHRLRKHRDILDDIIGRIVRAHVDGERRVASQTGAKTARHSGSSSAGQRYDEDEDDENDDNSNDEDDDGDAGADTSDNDATNAHEQHRQHAQQHRYPSQQQQQQQQQQEQVSHLDFVAVQSLLNLAAQQEPETCQPSPPASTTAATTTAATTTAAAAFEPPAGPASPFWTVHASPFATAVAGPSERALDFHATGSWSVDPYSLEMLGRMIAPE